ncbi:hypothetical protein ACFV3R_23065 [Streptomyces sp. NPDC059740]|uniref:hypothetical protein n=1 Tax=Streptomyces sp. NPDC059740 TaxID=3346926 RepID=UPI00364C2EAF
MTTPPPASPADGGPGRVGPGTALRGTRLLAAGYLSLSVLTLGAVFLLRHDAAAVDDAVWVRTAIVAVSALVTHLCASRAARGSRSAYRRLRVISAVMVVAIAVVVALPHFLPLWLRIEQGVCGVVLLGVVALVNGPEQRRAFALAG